MQRASPWSLCILGQCSKLYSCTCTLPPGPCRFASALAFLPWPRWKKLFYCRVYLFACLFFLFSFIFVFQGCPLLSLYTPQRAREREGDSERPFEGEMRIEMGCYWNVKERRWSKSICLWRHRTERTKNRSKMGEKGWKMGRDWESEGVWESRQMHKWKNKNILKIWISTGNMGVHDNERLIGCYKLKT